MNECYKNLPKKRMASGCLFFNEKGEVLIVKPTYKDYWEIPGGGVEDNESPWAACKREIKEELGLTLTVQNFLAVDYVSDTDGKGERLMFIFDGGIIDEKKVSEINLQKEELAELRFVTSEEAAKLLGPHLNVRIPTCMKAHESHSVLYLEDGQPVA